MADVRDEVVAAVLQIIDLAAKQGVFVGNDLSTAGHVRSELVMAMNESKAPAPKSPPKSEK